MEATMGMDFSKGVLAEVRRNLSHRNHVAKSLLNVHVDRELFDPANKEHREAFNVYRDTGKWPILFHPEQPYRNVVHMIERRLIEYALSL